VAPDSGGRSAQGREALVRGSTNEPVATAQDAWKVALAYARRWQIEMAFRNLKSEMAIQSVPVSQWESRLQLLGLVTLA
jgi:hypothetical protein